MTILARIPTDFSLDYEFECLEIVVDGIHFGSFSGTAELVLNDPRDGDFYVNHLAINGEKRERQTLKGYALTIRKRTDAALLIRHPAKDDQTFRAHLFRHLADALYASEDAAERFTSELEACRS